MEKTNILLTRIDNRLVHGQVGCTWTVTLGANLIVVADDVSAEDQIQQTLMSMTAKSSNVGICFSTVEHTAEIIANVDLGQTIFLVVRTPKEAHALYDYGVPIQELNVGNMHFSQGKRALSKKVYVDDEEYADLKYLKSKGVHVYIQDVPGDPVIEIN